MTYDEKFRKRAVAYKEAGHTFKELKAVFGICNCAYYKWVALKVEYGVYKPEKEINRKPGKVAMEQLKQAVEEKPDAYLAELAEPFGCTPQAIFYALKRLKITYKKRLSHTVREIQKNHDANIRNN